MAVAAYPALLGAIYDACLALDALADVEVVYGISPEIPYTDQLVIGGGSFDDDNAGDQSQQWATIGPGLERDEEGDVQCFAFGTQGDTGDAARRDAHERAWVIAEAVADLCRTAPTFAVPTVLWTSFSTNAQPRIGSDENGSFAVIPFTIHYRARI